MAAVRIHSLKKDRNDDVAFRHGRSNQIGSVFNEFYQRIPFFFTRDRMSLELVGQYRGWGCILVCNGPSIASGKYDLSLLKKPGVMTYGINNGAKTIRPNFWGCVDDPKRFLKSVWLDPGIMKFVPHAHHDKLLFDNEKWEDLKIDGKQVYVGDCPNVVYYHRNEKFNAERFLYEDTLNWGNSGEFGGGRSVMLPSLRILFLLGFRKVYLLGADFDMSETKTYHFDEQRNKGAVSCNMSTYAKMKDEYFPALKPFFDAEGFEVYNLNPDSKLKVFPFKSYEDAIAECTIPLGDVENERTWGLYCKPEDRPKWKEEPMPEQKAHLKTIANVHGRPQFANQSISQPVNQPVNRPAVKDLRTDVIRITNNGENGENGDNGGIDANWRNEGDERDEEVAAQEDQYVQEAQEVKRVFESVSPGIINSIRQDIKMKTLDQEMEPVEMGVAEMGVAETVSNENFAGVDWEKVANRRSEIRQEVNASAKFPRPPSGVPPIGKPPVRPSPRPPQPNYAQPNYAQSNYTQLNHVVQNPVQKSQPVKVQQPQQAKQDGKIEQIARPEVNFQHRADLVADSNTVSYVKEKILKAINSQNKQEKQERPEKPTVKPLKSIVLDDNGR